MPEWPDWWDWSLEFSPHLLKRMADRRFSETDLRLMLDDAECYYRSNDPDRYVVVSEFEGAPWQIVVEPDRQERVLVVVTAYPRS